MIFDVSLPTNIIDENMHDSLMNLHCTYRRQIDRPLTEWNKINGPQQDFRMKKDIHGKNELFG